MNKVIYNNFAALAEKHARISDSESSEYQSAGDIFNQQSRELINYASLTVNGIYLYDNELVFAEADDNIGYISAVMSNARREFSPSVDVAINLSNGYYSAPGITIHFWKNYCTEMTVTWYSDTTEIITVEKTFSKHPNSDDKIISCYVEQEVSNFNKVKISFKKSEMANQFVKIAGIDFGEQKEITDFHSNISMFFEIDTDAADVPAATCEFTARIPDFEPQEAQQLYIYGNDNKLYGRFTVESVTASGNNRYLLQCNDDAMSLDGSEFPAIAQGTHNVQEISKQIVESSKIIIDISEHSDTELTGFVEGKKSSRYALAMLSFALGCFVTGYSSDMLYFAQPRNRKSKFISSSQILGKAEYRKISPYTAVTLHQFETDFETVVATRTATLSKKSGSLSNNEKRFDKYSLMKNINERFEELKESAFGKNEIVFRAELTDEMLGDIIRVETPYNGEKIGIIKSMEISLGHKAIATFTLRERSFKEV